jgi:hypothetical protein
MQHGIAMRDGREHDFESNWHAGVGAAGAIGLRL